MYIVEITIASVIAIIALILGVIIKKDIKKAWRDLLDLFKKNKKSE